MEFYAEKGDQEKFNEINIAFHEAIYVVPNQSILSNY